MNRKTSEEAAQKERLAEKLRDLRTSHGYKQADVAAAIGIRQGTYSNYEKGKRTPGSVMIYRLANFYGLPADDLLKMCIPLDEDIYYDASAPTWQMEDEIDYITYMSDENIPEISRTDKELLYYFSKLTVVDKQEIIDFAAFKREQARRHFR